MSAALSSVQAKTTAATASSSNDQPSDVTAVRVASHSPAMQVNPPSSPQTFSASTYLVGGIDLSVIFQELFNGKRDNEFCKKFCIENATRTRILEEKVDKLIGINSKLDGECNQEREKARKAQERSDDLQKKLGFEMSNAEGEKRRADGLQESCDKLTQEIQLLREERDAKIAEIDSLNKRINEIRDENLAKDVKVRTDCGRVVRIYQIEAEELNEKIGKLTINLNGVRQAFCAASRQILGKDIAASEFLNPGRAFQVSREMINKDVEQKEKIAKLESALKEMEDIANKINEIYNFFCTTGSTQTSEGQSSNKRSSEQTDNDNAIPLNVFLGEEEGATSTTQQISSGEEDQPGASTLPQFTLLDKIAAIQERLDKEIAANASSAKAIAETDSAFEALMDQIGVPTHKRDSAGNLVKIVDRRKAIEPVLKSMREAIQFWLDHYRFRHTVTPQNMRESIQILIRNQRHVNSKSAVGRYLYRFVRIISCW